MNTSLRLLITEQCNLACSYCCNRIPGVRKQFRMVDSLDEINWQRYRDVSITGGEPFMNQDRLFSAAWRARDAGCNLYLYTNGTLLTKRRVKMLKKAGFSGVRIGVHENINKEVHRLYMLFRSLTLDIEPRFDIEDVHKNEVYSGYINYCKFWTRGECAPSVDEDMILWR
jgi:molybdenum cofactor biosynthesis enzyme MoaA